MTSDPAILVINCGSSSVKFALFADVEPLPPEHSYVDGGHKAIRQVSEAVESVRKFRDGTYAETFSFFYR